MTDETLPIEFKGRHDHISERMRDHATGKLARLRRFNDQILRIEVVADHVHEHPEVELLVHMRTGAPLVARQQGQTFANAIDELSEKMETQLRRLKEKRTDHKSHGADKRDTEVLDDDPSEETYDEVVRRTMRE